MMNLDRTVGGGIADLMAGQGNVASPGAFDFAQKSEPVMKMAAGGMPDPQTGIGALTGMQPTNYGISFSDNFNTLQRPDQQYMFKSLLGQGFTPEQLAGAATYQFGPEGQDYWNALAQSVSAPPPASNAFIAPENTQQITQPFTQNTAIDQQLGNTAPMGASSVYAPMTDIGGPPATQSQQDTFNPFLGQGVTSDQLAGAVTQQFEPQSQDYLTSLLGSAVSPIPAPAPLPEPSPQPFTPPAPSPLDTSPIGRQVDDTGYLAPERRAGWLATLDPAVRDAFLAAHPGYLPDVSAPPPAPKEGSPEWFKNYIYAGGADDATATQKGLQYVTDQNMRPQDAVNLWNQALGTNFSVNDFYKTSGKNPDRKAVVFGDSISSVMGYNKDGSADTSQGKSLQDVLSNYMNGVVDNVATGGQTSNDALTGNVGYGGFENYISQNHPTDVVLRYGAADAIKMGDADKSLSNIEQMIQIAQKYGATPTLVGVSPFYGGADSIGGNIAGYLTPDSAKVADKINSGIKDLAQKYGLNFVDVRSLSIPSGSLLDGVHQNAQFGRQMADLIGNSLQQPTQKVAGTTTPDQQTQQAKYSNFGGEGNWNWSSGVVFDPAGVHSEGNIFDRGNEAIVSDEPFWNPNSPTGDDLQKRVADLHANGGSAGISITPYAVFQGKATNEQLLNEIKKSNADFIALDPYYGYGVPADKLYSWVKDFIPQVNALGKEVKLVTQGFARAGQEQETNDYNSKLLALPGISEFVNFGKEDDTDLNKDDSWVSLNNDYNQQPKADRRTVNPVGSRYSKNEPTLKMARGGLSPQSEDDIVPATLIDQSPVIQQLQKAGLTETQPTFQAPSASPDVMSAVSQALQSGIPTFRDENDQVQSYKDIQVGSDTYRVTPSGEFQKLNPSDISGGTWYTAQGTLAPVSNIGPSAFGKLVNTGLKIAMATAAPELATGFGGGVLGSMGAGATVGAANAMASGVTDPQEILKGAAKGAAMAGITSGFNSADLGKTIGLDKSLTGTIASKAGEIADLLGPNVSDTTKDIVASTLTGGTKSLAQQGLGSLVTGKGFDPLAAFTEGAVASNIKDVLAGSSDFKALSPEAQKAVSSAVTAGALGRNPATAAISSYLGSTLSDLMPTGRLPEYPGGESPQLTSNVPSLTDYTQAPIDSKDYTQQLLDLVNLNAPVEVTGQAEPDVTPDVTGTTRSITAPVDQQVTTTGKTVAKEEEPVVETETPKVEPPKAGQQVPVTGKNIPKEEEPVIEEETPKAGQQVPVTGERIKTLPETVFDTEQENKPVEPVKDITDQKVGVTGTSLPDLLESIPSYEPPSLPEDLSVPPEQKVDVTGEKIKTLPETVFDTEDETKPVKDETAQKVDVTGKNIPLETIEPYEPPSLPEKLSIPAEQKVDVTGEKIKTLPETIFDVEQENKPVEPVKDITDQKVGVTGTSLPDLLESIPSYEPPTLPEPLSVPADQKVDITAKNIEKQLEDAGIKYLPPSISDILNQKAEVEGKRIEPVEDVTSQKVDVTGGTIPKLLETIAPYEPPTLPTLPPVPPAVSAPSPAAKVIPKAPAPAPGVSAPMSSAQSQALMSLLEQFPLFQSVFYKKMQQEEMLKQLAQQHSVDRMLEEIQKGQYSDGSVEDLMNYLEGK